MEMGRGMRKKKDSNFCCLWLHISKLCFMWLGSSVGGVEVAAGVHLWQVAESGTLTLVKYSVRNIKYPKVIKLQFASPLD